MWSLLEKVGNAIMQSWCWWPLLDTSGLLTVTTGHPFITLFTIFYQMWWLVLIVDLTWCRITWERNFTQWLCRLWQAMAMPMRVCFLFFNWVNGGGKTQAECGPGSPGLNEKRASWALAGGITSQLSPLDCRCDVDVSSSSRCLDFPTTMLPNWESWVKQPFLP